jgi:hypothetical protein
LRAHLTSQECADCGLTHLRANRAFIVGLEDILIMLTGTPFDWELGGFSREWFTNYFDK